MGEAMKKKISEPNAFIKVKERLSKRSKTKKEEAYHDDLQKGGIKDNAKPKNEIDSDSGDVKILENKEKEKNIFQKLLKRFSFRKKKKDKVTTKAKDNDYNNEEIEQEVSMNKDDTKSLSSVDEELSALCNENTEEPQETTPSVPAISSSMPPLPTTRRPPSSATTAQSRPVSQLDAALKQFRLSTAASRENLRSSRVDLEKMEDTVRSIVGSRPSSRAGTPTPDSWRSRAPPENRQLSEQWAKLSASLTDLR